MNTQSPPFALIILLIAFLTSFILRKVFPQKPQSFRYESIEGLRGFLALSVFIHHAAIWYSFIQTGFWRAPDTNFYNQLGRVGVTLFFMITSFLFTDKLINSDNTFHWGQYFKARVMRLTPMFYTAFGIQLIIIMASCGWKRNVGILSFLKSLIHWLCFTYFDAPRINNYGFTSLSAAGVVWSLPYEWLFYFCIPIIAFILLRRKVPAIFLIISVVMISLFIWFHPLTVAGMYPFIVGAIAPVLLKYTRIRQVAEHPLLSVIVILCIGLLKMYHDVITLPSMLLVTVAFTLIACGNSFFGLLKNKSLKLLGDIGYSTYLLHGMLLFSLIFFGVGYEHAKQFTPMQYCLLVCALTPVLVVISYCGFRFIEQPFMKKKAGKNS